MKKENSKLIELIERLKKEKKGIWKVIASELEKPKRRKTEVNISKIARYTKAGAKVVVPGKVLGSGDIDHEVTVAAFSFSEGARKLIEDKKGKAIGIEEMLKVNPEGKDIIILK